MPPEDPFQSTLNSVSPEKLESMKDALFDFKEMGNKHMQAADKFQAGLDKVVDVLLILVLKFGRATAYQIVMGIVQVVCLVTLVISTIQILTLRSEIRGLLDRQEEFARSQKRIEKTTNETQEAVNTTSKAVEATQETVKKVEQAAPKVEVDKRTGKAKLVVTVPPKPAPKAVPDKKLEIQIE